MSDDDKGFKADPALLRRLRDKQYLDQQLEQALDNPARDAHLAKLKPKLKPGEDPFYYDVSRRLSSPSLTPVPTRDVDDNSGAEPAGEPRDAGAQVAATAPANDAAAAFDGPKPAPNESPKALDAGADASGAPPRVSAPSPWAKNAAVDDLDKAALPSAHLPAPPTSVPIPPEPPSEPPHAATRPFPQWAKGALASFAVFAVAAVAVLGSRLPPSGTQAPSATTTPGPVPTVATAASVAPTASVAQRADSSATAEPSAASTVSAVAPPPVPSAASTATPSSAVPPAPKRPVDKHRDVVPPVVKTAEPQPQPPPPKPEAID